MARHFTQASSEKINLSLGAGGSITGAVTLAAIINCTAGSTSSGVGIVVIGTSGERRLNIGSARQLRLVSGGSQSNSTTTVANAWQFVAATKAAGSATPRFHFYTFSTGVWVHENGSAAIGDSTPSGASDIGWIAALGGFYFDGDIAIAGAWATALTDAQVETLAFSLTPWHSYSNNGLWVLDQAATTIKVWDQSGNGANESSLTGTSVATSAVPVWNRGAPPVVVAFNVVRAATGTAYMAAGAVMLDTGTKTISGAVTAESSAASLATASKAAAGQTTMQSGVTSRDTTSKGGLGATIAAVASTARTSGIRAALGALRALVGAWFTSSIPSRDIDYQLGAPFTAWHASAPEFGWELDQPHTGWMGSAPRTGWDSGKVQTGWRADAPTM